VVKAWWDLGDELLVKYNHFRIYDPEKRRSGPLQVPDWWNKAVVEQDGLTPLKRER
jgi:dipeptidase